MPSHIIFLWYFSSIANYNAIKNFFPLFLYNYPFFTHISLIHNVNDTLNPLSFLAHIKWMLRSSIWYRFFLFYFIKFMLCPFLS